MPSLRSGGGLGGGQASQAETRLSQYAKGLGPHPTLSGSLPCDSGEVQVGLRAPRAASVRPDALDPHPISCPLPGGRDDIYFKYVWIGLCHAYHRSDRRRCTESGAQPGAHRAQEARSGHLGVGEKGDCFLSPRKGRSRGSPCSRYPPTPHRSRSRWPNKPRKVSEGCAFVRQCPDRARLAEPAAALASRILILEGSLRTDELGAKHCGRPVFPRPVL